MAEKKWWYREGRALLDEIRGEKSGRGRGELWFLGQHGFAAALGGAVCYIDVILTDLKDREGNTMRAFAPPFGPGEKQRVDYVFCTHNHDDHLNPETLTPLAAANPEALFILPRSQYPVLPAAGIDPSRVIGIDAGETITLPGPQGVRVTGIPAFHHEPILDGEGRYASMGFVIRGGGVSLYHSGDTWVTPELIRALKAGAPIDIALLPINGADWERTAAGIIGNVSAIEAVKLARALGVDLVIPSHYNMMPANSENPALFVDYLYRLCPAMRFHVCALGERFIYEKAE
ncbi:MAG: MBL fold metallo-hydrolase [Treponema sp.]|jgi:L-ascorbate metabolism protein UlaG (beta-lactamase superfamily)|nr:MBL fold metallo-hydrolase [Treponema sp.]